jgi:hypothetical protein
VASPPGRIADAIRSHPPPSQARPERAEAEAREMTDRRAANRPGLIALVWARLKLWSGTHHARAAYSRLFDGDRKPPR